MADWQQQTLRMPKGHHWQARPNEMIFVADKGAVRFNYPRTWVMAPQPGGSFQFRDRPEPDDDALLEISVMRLNPDVLWDDLPLEDLLRHLRDDDKRGLQPGEPVRVERPNLDLVWVESTFTDPSENRPAYDRALLGFNNNVMPFITMVFWADHRDRFAPVWDRVLETLHVGEPVTVRGPSRKQRRDAARQFWHGGKKF